jgi:hypothetical protein
MKEKNYKALAEATKPGYNLEQVMRELSEAASGFFWDAAYAAVVLKIDRENAAVIFADDPLIEEKLRSLLTERGPRPFPLGLPVGFIAWTRGDGETAAMRSDLTEAGAANDAPLDLVFQRGPIPLPEPKETRCN